MAFQTFIKGTCSLALGLTAFTTINCAIAESTRVYPREGHQISLGIAMPTVESRAVSASPNLPEVEVDLTDLDLEDDDLSGHLEYRWRFAERWVLDAFAYQYNDQGNALATTDFNFDGVEYKVGALIESDLEIDTYVIGVLYSAYQSERAELLVGGGVHAIDVGISFRSTVFANDMSETFGASSDTLLAPVPNLRAQATYEFTDRFGADMTLGWLSAEVDDYDGSFSYISARLRYRMTNNSFVAIGYQYTEIDITRDKGNQRTQSFEADNYGPTLQFSYAF